MALQLRDDLFWCNCQGRAVFLDTRADRYFCLPQPVNHAFLRLAAGEAEPGDTKRLRMMVSRRLLLETEADTPILSPPSLAVPTHDYLDDEGRGAGLFCVLRGFAAEVRAARALRTRSFQFVVEAVRASKFVVKPHGETARAIEAIIRGSSAVSLITRRHDRCLVRALAVHSACGKCGCRAKLVFGVIAHPFAAHCWVQLGTAVLVGAYEEARLYTPILVIE